MYETDLTESERVPPFHLHATVVNLAFWATIHAQSAVVRAIRPADVTNECIPV